MTENLEKIRDILRSSITSVKNYYIGDPVLIPASYLPCITIDQVSTAVKTLDSARDIYTTNVQLSYIMDIRSDFNKRPDEVIGTTTLREVMEGRDASGDLKTNSIVYLLTKNWDLGSDWKINNEYNINYAEKARWEQLITREAILTFSIYKAQLRG